MKPSNTDWPWQPEDQIASLSSSADSDLAEQIARLAARCFRGEEGTQLLNYLKAQTLDRALGPDVSDATLRHLEGQRQLVRQICTLIEHGRRGPDGQPEQKGETE